MKYSGYSDVALNFQQMFKSLKIANLVIIANLKKSSIIMTVTSYLKSCWEAFFLF